MSIEDSDPRPPAEAGSLGIAGGAHASAAGTIGQSPTAPVPDASAWVVAQLRKAAVADLRACFDAFCDRWIDPVYGFALRVRRDPRDAELLTEQLLVRALGSLLGEETPSVVGEAIAERSPGAGDSSAEPKIGEIGADRCGH